MSLIMEFKRIEKTYDFVVAGGGFTGICCSIMAARQGLKTALITNRGFIGGNSGAEVRCPVDGADGEHQFNFNARETGLIEEIRLRNLYVNPEGNSYRWDMVLMDFIAAEENLDLYLNTCIDQVITDQELANQMCEPDSPKKSKAGRNEISDEASDRPCRIEYISGIQTTTEKRFVFRAPLFADNTGDGTLSRLAGCSFMQGAEAPDVFGEKIAAKEDAGGVLLGTLTYTAKDQGHPVEFIPPENAFSMEKSGCLEHREIPAEMFARFVWFYETGAGLDQAKDSEEVAAAHRALLFSIWDYIKQHPEKYGAENYDFEYISPYVGKRESRRIIGKKILTEKDICEQREHDDACGYGGWAIDLHSPLGFFGKDPENWWVYLKGLYSIPLSCAIARDCRNLFVIGRCFSVSHVALGSTRLNATLATVGQAAGIAAAIALKKGIDLHDFGPEEMKQLHRIQWRQDQTVLGYRNEDAADLALSAKASASSEKSYRMTRPTAFFKTDTIYGQSMPVKPGLKALRFAYRAGKDSKLTVKVYRTGKRQNYGPEVLLKTFDLKLQKTGNAGNSDKETSAGRTKREAAETKTYVNQAQDYGWFTLDLSDLQLQEEFLFFLFDGCGEKQLELAAGTERLPSVSAIMQRENTLPNIMDYETLSPLPGEWMKLGIPLKLRKYSTASQPNINYAFCFETLPSLSFYGAENVNNGYLRPYGQPNLWVAEGGKDEEIVLSFEKPVPVSEIDVTFDTNLNFRVRNVKPYSFNTIAETVKDYEVYINNESGTWEPVRCVVGNYQRFNRICLKDKKTASALKIRVLATNGCPNAAIYSISVY